MQVMIAPSLRTLLEHSIDYAGMYPPASLGLEEALTNHARYIRLDDSWMLNAFVLPVEKFEETKQFLSQFDPGHPFCVSVLGPKTENAAAFWEAIEEADEAIRAARLGREVGLSDWVKIEVIGDQATLYPDVQATLEATRVLVKEGFTVLPYTSDDIVFAKRLIEVGAAAVMPLGAPIGSGLGLQNTANLRILRELITEVPLIVDAGVGTASDATVAMELGFDGVLMNTAIAQAKDPLLMAEAMQHAVLAGRQAYLAGRMPRKLYATASSPLEGISK